MNRAKILPGIVLSISAAFLGLLVGVLFVKFFMPASGWDALANVLGGMMLGTLAGFILGIVLAVKLQLPMLRRVAWTALALALAILAVTYAYNRLNEEPPEPPPPELAPRPTTPAS